MNCIICNNPLVGRQKSYCSRKCHNKNGNYIHQSYLKQQERAKSRKNKLIELLGGQCSVCGYSKNTSALEFHHMDPLEKDINLDSRKLSNSTWERCLEEVKKCTLLCSNCHREHHHPHLNCQ